MKTFWLSLLLLSCAVLRAEETKAPADEPMTETPITESDRQHWAYSKLERPPVPAVTQAEWLINAIDQFILSRLEKAELKPAPQASRTTLIRRLSFNLTGLPPSPEEVQRFVSDESPDAYEQLIERLLASPSYGERWGQHWLDLARFAETDGYEHDKVRNEAWRYRDWVIEALNADLPFDQFTRQQLAGDEISSEFRVATGFLICGPDMPDVNQQDERRSDFLNDMTGTVAQVFLGTQLGCAQCHDHKFDPVSQLDFYRLRAFFDHAFDFKRDVLAAPPSGNKVSASSRLLIRGDFRRPGPEVEPDFLRVANHTSAKPQVTKDRSNLRTQLADWLTQPDHPLTTRVLANRLWQFHFGMGLSGTANDFGIVGESPAHLDLLNWLATEIPRRDWSLKEMHRLIVSSATYRQASRLPDDASADVRKHWERSLDRDRLLKLHSRGVQRRLEGEAIRDAMLSVSGRLNAQRTGPGIRPPLPPELVQTLLKNQWPVTEKATEWDRRSIYLFVRRNLRYPLFEAFDKPDTNASCPRRNQSTIAPQALFLLNSDLTRELSRDFARLARQEAGDERVRQIKFCYQQALGRNPTWDEIDVGTRFLEKGDDSSLRELCAAIFNLNEFIYID